MLQAKLSIRPSIHHTRESSLNGSRCQNPLCTTQESYFLCLEAKFPDHEFRESHSTSALKSHSDFLCINNSNLLPVLHRFRDMTAYWSNFRSQQGVPLFNAPPVEGKNWTHNPPYLGNGARQEVSYYYSHIGSRM